MQSNSGQIKDADVNLIGDIIFNDVKNASTSRTSKSSQRKPEVKKELPKVSLSY